MVKASKKWKTFGWYNSLAEIAKEGVFNRDGYTAMESAMISNFWDAFTYLANKYHNLR